MLYCQAITCLGLHLAKKIYAGAALGCHAFINSLVYMAAAVTTVHGKEECLCSTLLLYLKTEGDATPAAHIHRVRPVESASMTVPGLHPCSCLASYGVFFYQDQILYTALTAGELQR